MFMWSFGPLDLCHVYLESQYPLVWDSTFNEIMGYFRVEWPMTLG